MIRNSTLTLSHFSDVVQEIDVATSGDEALLVPFLKDWIDHSCISDLRRSLDLASMYHICTDTNSITLRQDCKQSVVQKIILANKTNYDVSALLARRLVRFFPDSDVSTMVPNILSAYSHLKGKIKPNLHMAHVQTVLNQWCSHRRFGLMHKACPFGCEDMNDDIEHCIICPKFQAHFHNRMSQFGLTLNMDAILLFTHNGTILPPFVRHYILIYVTTCFHCYNHCRHSREFNRRLVTFTLKKLAVHCPRTRNIINAFSSRKLIINNLGSASSGLPAINNSI